MKRTSGIVTLAVIAGSLCFGYKAVADIAITATPGMDYEGATIATTGAAGDGTVVIADYKNSGTTIFTTNVTGNVSFVVEELAADGVYDITATYGDSVVFKRLYQGEAGYTNTAWFVENTATTGVGTWSTNKADIVKDERFVFVDDDSDELLSASFTPTATQSDRLAVLELDMKFSAELPDDCIPDVSTAQGAVRVVKCDDDYWFSCYAGDRWHTNTTVAASLATNYVVRATFDKLNGTVSYDVKEYGAATYDNIYASSSAITVGSVTNVAFVGAGSVGYIDGKSNEDKAEAWICQAGDPAVKYKSIEEAATNATSIALLWDASWFALEETTPHAPHAISGDRALKVLGGWIASGTTLPASTTLVGGKYTETSKAAFSDKIASGTHRWASRADSSYTWEVLTGSEPIASDEKVYPVTSGTTTIDLAFSKEELTEKGICDGSETTDAQVQDKLNATGDNHNPAWENVVLGLANDDESSIPVVTPVQSSDADTVTFALGGVTIDPKYNANVYYKVKTYDSSWTETSTSDPALASDNISVALPASGVQYYKLEVDALGAH